MRGASTLATLPLREAGMIAAALAASAVILLRAPRARALALLAALALVPALIVGDVWASDQLASVRSRPLLAAAAAAAGLAGLAGLAALLLRRPGLLPPLAVGALPFRVPVETGGETAYLLVPLYLVIGAAGAAYAWERLRGGAEPRTAPRERPAHWLEVALIGAVVLYAVQAAYSTDVQAALKNVAFFYVPFLLLFRLLSATHWSARVVRTTLGVALGLAVAFVAIGFWEYATRHLLWNPKLIASNQLQPYFRVNSLFFDPNIYGRFLAMTMTALAAVLVWARAGRTAAAAAGALALLWAGLVLTLSQSSLAALVVALVVVAALRWGPRAVALPVLAAAVAGVALLVAAPGLVKLGSGRSLDDATSGRVDLVSGGVEMFAERPLAGYGSGSFTERFREREDVTNERVAAASHTTPVTIAAEQGIAGLVVYALLLLAAARAVLAGLRPRRRGPPWDLHRAARAALAAMLFGLVVHTLVYAAFLEDPMTWTILGVALGLRVSSPGEEDDAAAEPRPAVQAAPA